MAGILALSVSRLQAFGSEEGSFCGRERPAACQYGGLTCEAVADRNSSGSSESLTAHPLS